MNRLVLSTFRGRLLRAAGLGALAPFLCTYACGGIAVVDELGSAGGAGGQNGTGGDSSSASSSTDAGTGTTAVSTGSMVSTATTNTTTTGGGGGGQPTEITCFPPSGDPAPCFSVDEAMNVYGSCTQDTFEYIEQWVSGPYLEDGACCYEVVANDFCGVGRPLRIDGEAVTARALRGDARWVSPIEALEGGLTEAERTVLAEAWLHDALFEHASVAAFSRFSLELMALGAPPELLRDAHRAALDEVEHARLCFALASRFAGEPVGPGPLRTEGLSLHADLATFARDTVLEGCVGETLASLVAEGQRDRASDPATRKALATIAADEARHAELAWATVAWALRVGGAPVREAVSQAFSQAHDHLPTIHCAAGLTAFGRLDERETYRIMAEAMSQVVIPCAHQLLARIAPQSTEARTLHEEEPRP